MSKFSGHSIAKTMISGGAIQVTVSVAGATISNQPCRMVYMTAATLTAINTGNLRVCVGAVCTSLVGIVVPAVTVVLSVNGGRTPQPLCLPVDNLNKLSFWTPVAGNEDKVDVMWLR